MFEPPSAWTVELETPFIEKEATSGAIKAAPATRASSDLRLARFTVVSVSSTCWSFFSLGIKITPDS